MEGFLGRSDSMVKLRGINVFPQALSSILAGSPGFNGEYICTLTRREGREDLLVSVECAVPAVPELLQQYKSLLRRELGVEVDVELVAPKALSPLTGVESRQKPIRLLDKR
jgi:phenylacetate-CoA ligase